MEFPESVLQSLLDTMATSTLEENVQMENDFEREREIKPKNKEPVPQIRKPSRRFKSNPKILNTVTVLFSKEGKYRAAIQTVFNDVDDSNYFRVDVTGKTFVSHGGAINHARKWLRKKRFKYYKKNPKEKPRIKTVRLNPKPKRKFKTINKLHIMEKATAKILIRMSDKKLKLHDNYSRKKFDNEKTTAVSGETTDFNVAIYTTMVDGTKKERKLVAKMLKKFTHEPFRKTNLFY